MTQSTMMLGNIFFGKELFDFPFPQYNELHEKVTYDFH